MTREERAARSNLVALGADERGRRLLQLALRGIQESGRGLTIGCWVKPSGGVAGCVFQHAYWQGVGEGAFAPAATASSEIRSFVPAEDFRLVMDAIRALDGLGKRRFLRRRGLRRALDEAAWRDAVERLLVDALAVGAPPPERAPALTSA
jgi:hypothetical protein